MVVLLLSLESLMALPRPTFGGAGGAAARLPRPTPPKTGVSATFRACAGPLLAFAFSTIEVRMLAAPPGGAGGRGFIGETGRERYDLPGVVGRTGEPGSVLELADRGERTCEAATLFLDVVRSPGIGPRARFLGFSMSSFSLSVITSPLPSQQGNTNENMKGHTYAASSRHGEMGLLAHCSGLARCCSQVVLLLQEMRMNWG